MANIQKRYGNQQGGVFSGGLMKRLIPALFVFGSITVTVTFLMAARRGESARRAPVASHVAVSFDMSPPLEQFIPDKAVVIHRAVESPAENQGDRKGPGAGLGATPPTPP